MNRAFVDIVNYVQNCAIIFIAAGQTLICFHRISGKIKQCGIIGAIIIASFEITVAEIAGKCSAIFIPGYQRIINFGIIITASRNLISIIG